MLENSPLQEALQGYKISLPAILSDLTHVTVLADQADIFVSQEIRAQLPKTSGQPKLSVVINEDPKPRKTLRVGVVLSGGQAAGGHNVIVGLFDALKKLHPDTLLFGFLNGPSGILKGSYQELTAETINPFRNMGGFDLIGSGRTKIETPEQFAEAKRVIEELKLDGLVVIGGDDSNTNAALMAEYFLAEGCLCTVVGAPKTIDGDLRSEDIELSFGFDTACKTFSETIGNIARDALSAKKYYHFIRLMGRSASHITLECALQTHPNAALIGEEIAAKGATLQQVTEQLADIICQRSEVGKDYGVVLIPEGLIEFIAECQKLIKELSLNQEPSQLSTEARGCFDKLPSNIQAQLTLDRDPHGNVQVSKIESERLLLAMVEVELNRRKAHGTYKGKFNGQPHFLGYEGRAGFPSVFDATYCYTLGYICALLIDAQATGYIAYVKGLALPAEKWTLGGVSLAALMHLEERKGVKKLVIRKALVDLGGQAFSAFARQRAEWAVQDHYRYPGPIQYFGPSAIVLFVPLSL